MEIIFPLRARLPAITADILECRMQIVCHCRRKCEDFAIVTTLWWIHRQHFVTYRGRGHA
jgi:hypothetical protein